MSPLAGYLSQEFRLQSWTTEQGLPHNQINFLLQTHDGYLWIATRYGLVRYDGARFKYYNQANTPAMLSENIVCLAENPPGCLWAGAVGGLLQYSNHVFRFFALPEGMAAAYVHALCGRRAGGVWVGSDARTVSHG
jgi:ligand-binding sensor domain-containing protein